MMSAHAQTIQASAATEHEWQSADIDVATLESLRMSPCAFFTATHKTRPSHSSPTYALLPNSQVVSQADEAAVDKILGACTGAPKADAGAWAELLTRFHWQVGPGTVLYSAAQAQTAIAGFTAEGGTFFAPKKVAGQGVEVQFFVMNFETSKLYEIKASWKAGQVQVTKTAR